MTIPHCPASFFDAYLITALWSSNDESRDDGGDPMDANYDVSSFTKAALRKMRQDCDLFYFENRRDLTCDGVKYGPDFDQDGRAGHDFWLTRNHHGAGFWDGDWPKEDNISKRLTDAAYAFGEVNLYVTARKRIGVS